MSLFDQIMFNNHANFYTSVLVVSVSVYQKCAYKLNCKPLWVLADSGNDEWRHIQFVVFICLEIMWSHIGQWTRFMKRIVVGEVLSKAPTNVMWHGPLIVTMVVLWRRLEVTIIHCCHPAIIFVAISITICSVYYSCDHCSTVVLFCSIKPAGAHELPKVVKEHETYKLSGAITMQIHRPLLLTSFHIRKP